MATPDSNTDYAGMLSKIMHSGTIKWDLRNMKIRDPFILQMNSKLSQDPNIDTATRDGPDRFTADGIMRTSPAKTRAQAERDAAAAARAAERAEMLEA